MQKFLSIPITATGETAQLVAVDSIVLIEQNDVTVHYANGAAAGDVVTINHTTMATNDRSVRDRIQDSVIDALQTSWHKPKYDVTLSGLTAAAGGAVQVTSIAIA